MVEENNNLWIKKQWDLDLRCFPIIRLTDFGRIMDFPEFVWFNCVSGTITPLTPDGTQVKRPPPLLQITSNFLVFYGLSHGTTFEKNGVAQNPIYSKIWWTTSWNCWVENLLLQKNPLQDFISSLIAVILTNESTEFITGHVGGNLEEELHYFAAKNGWEG